MLILYSAILMYLLYLMRSFKAVHFVISLQGADLLNKVGRLHKFMNWDRAMLTVYMFET